MIKHKYSTTVELGDYYEFCTHPPKQPSRVHYGIIIELNSDTKSVNFECINYDKKMKKIPNGEVHKNITAIRGIGYIHNNTWKE